MAMISPNDAPDAYLTGAQLAFGASNNVEHTYTRAELGARFTREGSGTAELKTERFGMAYQL